MKDAQTGFVQSKLQDGSYVINYPNGVLYQGEVVESMRHGYGTLYAPQFRNVPQKINFDSEDFDFDQILKLTKYKTFEGEFRFNQFQGMGVEYFPDGRVKFKGNFRQGERHGFGTLFRPETDQEEVIFQGEFVNGEPLSQRIAKGGILTIPEEDATIYDHRADPKTSQFSFAGSMDQPQFFNSRYISSRQLSDLGEEDEDDYKEFWNDAEEQLNTELIQEKIASAKDDPYQENQIKDDRMGTVQQIDRNLVQSLLGNGDQVADSDWGQLKDLTEKHQALISKVEN